MIWVLWFIKYFGSWKQKLHLEGRKLAFEGHELTKQVWSAVLMDTDICLSPNDDWCIIPKKKSMMNTHLIDGMKAVLTFEPTQRENSTKPQSTHSIQSY